MNISSLVPENRKKEELAALKKLNRAEVPEPYRAQRLTKDNLDRSESYAAGFSDKLRIALYLQQL